MDTRWAVGAGESHCAGAGGDGVLGVGALVQRHFESGALIAEKDRADIAAYYGSGEHKADMFDGGEVSGDGYNKADYIIGTTLRHMCFDLTVQEE